MKLWSLRNLFRRAPLAAWDPEPEYSTLDRASGLGCPDFVPVNL